MAVWPRKVGKVDDIAAAYAPLLPQPQPRATATATNAKELTVGLPQRDV